ncbi:EFR1 family ferrodoxin [Crassaminicella profunda]|uniref:EFR1 family ferrodoxin n=1 Tax=Crassaminicella profunda TaxID=1286698 RepID=UPI001CA6D672|nr:EFR1 family ferrodoxin [Crassaminicella profunda]QZY53873.1 EFR1 family ferrodoxin [Crassaminicella profunda]
MQTTIYYFSATGNSLAMAKKIATHLGNTKLISIPKLINQNEITVMTSKVGFIFPVYAWGMPRIVADFVEKLKFKNTEYAFAIATNAGTIAGTLLQLQKALKKSNIHLNAGFSVTAPNHTPLSEDGLAIIKFMHSISGKQVYASYEERLSEIVSIVKNNQPHKIETTSWLSNKVGSFLYKGAMKTFQVADQNFSVNENCTHCNKCVTVCPRNNIKMKENKPVWLNNCELCFACFEWCPMEAIQYKGTPKDLKRSHNDEVTYEEIIAKGSET